ncbi:MAG: protein phosphatase 2C domain-containing protein [Pseudomonadota bacterium]
MPDPETNLPLSGRSAFRLHGAALSHIGLVRQQNEDATLADPTRCIWAVADGMGGHHHGRLAANMTIDALSEYRPNRNPGVEIERVLKSANQQILKHAKSLGVDRMGATAVVLAIVGGRAFIAWVGDARCYVMRSGRLHQVTQDHTVVQDLVDRGLLDPADADDHPEANVVTRGLGVLPGIEIDFRKVELLDGDRLLACSDGLTGVTPDIAVSEALRSTETVEEACCALIDVTLDRGAKDNVSVVVIDVRAVHS